MLVHYISFVRIDERWKECVIVGKTIQSKEDQVKYLKERLTIFMEVLDNIEPENTELEDIDRLIE